MFKKLLSLLLIMFMVLPICGKTTFILAEEDEEEESTGCYIGDDYFTLEECNQMYDKANQHIKDLNNEISEAKKNQEEYQKLANKYASEAQSMQDDIDVLSAQIEELKTRIEVLQKQIEENEAKVEEINKRVKNRMVESQKTMHFNGYLEFILGSKSFSDMLSRIYGVEAIVSKDKNDRESYINIITQLTNDKLELDNAKKTLDESYEELVIKQEEFKVMQEMYEEEAAKAQMLYDQMTAERENVKDSFEELAKALDKTIPPSYDFVAAVHNSWISDGVWNYSDDFLDGQWHLGSDYAASRGTEVHAPAAGVIIRADDSCYDHTDAQLYGQVASCGAWIAGGGNQVYLMCEVNETVYAFIFFHLHSVNVSYGDFVFQDDVIGTVGSSGKSTGPHCHIEMYKLGYGSLVDYLEMGWSATFSVGRGSDAYGNRCEYSDGSYRQGSPCILDPAMYLPG